MKLNLSVDNLTTIRWWVDASHAVHNDCRGHTGAMMSMGKGATISFSNKHKLNTKSSSKSELVSANQALSSILHTQYFIEAQGYSVEQNILFQDNHSTMQLEVNGSFSSSKCTKHIKSRYYFICDKIADDDLKVMYCPTEIMWADVLTKPKQGAPFCLDRSHLMNILINYDDNVERSKTHPLLLPKDERNTQLNDRLPKAPLIHPGSVLRTEHSSPPSSPVSTCPKTNDLLPITWNRESHPKSITWADQVRMPLAT
jgi:hypothetical protein